MRITIEGARQTPSWITLEQALQEMLEARDHGAGHGRLTRIARLDQRADHRSPGVYELNFEYTRFDTPEVELVVLEVK